MIGIEVRTLRLENALYRLSEAARVDFGQVIKQEAKYVLQTIIKFTPPPDRAAGRGAVSGDLANLSNALSFEYFKGRETEGGFYRSISRYIRRRDTPKLQQLFNLPQLTGFYGLRVIGSVDELKREHLQHRTKYGRVGRKLPLASYAADYKKLQRDIWDRVGWTVSGWVPAANSCGAKYPRWAAKLKPRADGKSQTAGVVQANYGTNPFFTARNLNVKIPNYENRVVRSALTSRIGITQRKLQRVLSGKAVNLGFVRVKGGSPITES